MNPHRRGLIALILFAPLLAAGPALAGAPAYISAAQVDLTRLLPPPTVAGSAQDRADQAEVLAIQQAATPERIALANEDVAETVYAMFGRTLGPAFNPAKLGPADLFFTRVTDSEDDTTDPAKAFFKRVRPFLANPEIKALVKPSRSGAYPSGHTTRVTMCAIIVAAMLPEQRDAIWARAQEYQMSRVVGGMHYLNDLEGGRLAGTAMAAAMFADPGFRADFAVARTQVRAALGM